MSTEDMVETPLGVKDAGCGDLEPLWLMAQSVPTASLVPCLQLLPVGWSVAEVAVNNGRSLITLNHDRAGKRALMVEFTAACDPTVATEVTSEHPGARRYVRIDPTAPGFSATSAYDFPGGCVTQRFSAAAPSALRMSDTAATELGFIPPAGARPGTGAALQRAAAAESPGRIMSQPGLQPRWATLEDLTRWRLRSRTGHLRRVWMAVTAGVSFGRAMVMTQAATAVHTTAPTVGPAIGVGLTYSMLWSQGSWQSRARAARGRRPCGGCRGLDMAGASQQGRRVGLSWPVGRAMDLPVDESTSATSQGLQQALKQGAGGGLGRDLGGS